MSVFAILLATASAAALPFSSALAANQDEIQVYDDSIEKPGESGLEIHFNTTPIGRAFELYPGEITNDQGYRVTPEFSYGLTKDLELGFYLDTQQDGAGTDYFVGTKYRVKWLPIHPDDNGGLFAGANIEFSVVGERFSQSPEGLELRLIDGYRSKDWLIAVNPIFDWGLSGEAASSDPEFTAAIKITRKVAEGISAGIEYYGDLGQLGHIPAWDKQDQRIYAVTDVNLPPFVFNLGVGVGLSRTADALTIKTIWEVPVEEIFKR
ncbi:MAG: hypothetical protein ACLPX9_17350 [Rhodomicrobium sp.]